MKFNYRNMQFLKEMGAKLIKSEYKIEMIDFLKLKAFVNKVDIFEKRNGKKVKLEHHFGRWISFSKDLVRYGKKKIKGITDDWGVADREEFVSQISTQYLRKEDKQKIIDDYLKLYVKNKKKRG